MSNTDLRIRSTGAFKLKNVKGKNQQTINLKSFGFVPATIIIEAVEGLKNTFIVYGVADEEQNVILPKN